MTILPVLINAEIHCLIHRGLILRMQNIGTIKPKNLVYKNYRSVTGRMQQILSCMFCNET